MQVILTHEQADFDALASMLGAYLLQKDAYPVLPAVMNRNTQSFIHLYGADLPFVKSDALPNEPISSITLVDTQSLVTLKGIRKDTQVFVIDHHQKKSDLPESWHFEAWTRSPAPPVSSRACRRTMGT
jgi:tRNA nucleotidyltransferase (CCA-adding enzyme)